MGDRSEDVTNYEKPTPPPLRDVREGQIPKRRGRPPKPRPIVPVKLPDGVMRAEDVEPMERQLDHVALPDGWNAGPLVPPATSPVPLLTLHLQRVGAEITDGGGTVHIPAPALLPEGARVVAHFYKED